MIKINLTDDVKRRVWEITKRARRDAQRLGAKNRYNNDDPESYFNSYLGEYAVHVATKQPWHIVEHGELDFRNRPRCDIGNDIEVRTITSKNRKLTIKHDDDDNWRNVLVYVDKKRGWAHLMGWIRAGDGKKTDYLYKPNDDWVKKRINPPKPFWLVPRDHLRHVCFLWPFV